MMLRLGIQTIKRKDTAQAAEVERAQNNFRVAALELTALLLWNGDYEKLFNLQYSRHN